MFPMTFTINNAAELQNVMAAMGNPEMLTPFGKRPLAPKPTEQQAQPAEFAPMGGGLAPAQAQPAPPPPPPEPTEQPAPVSPAPQQLTYDDDVVKAVHEHLNTHGRESALAAIRSFGVENAKDLPEDKWGDLIAKLQAGQAA